MEDLWRKSDGTPSKRDGRGKRWRARYVDAEGREFTKSFATKPPAKAWIDAQVTAIGTGTHVAPGAGNVTVGVLYEQFRGQWGHLTENTRAARESAWSARVRDQWAEKRISDITTSKARTWVTNMVERKVGAASIEAALGLLRMICAMAVDDKLIAVNPLDRVKGPKRQHTQRAYLDHHQVEVLAGSFARPSDQTLARFLAYSGLRFGEATATTVGSFDMLRRQVHVNEAAAEVRGKLVIGPPKDWEKRTVSVPGFLLAELSELMVGKKRDDLVFTAPEGGRLRLNTWRGRAWATALEAATVATDKQRSLEQKAGQTMTSDFPQVTPHDLRHTAASLAVSAGANVLVVQRMLGHESAALTLDTYADLFGSDLASVSGALDAARTAALASRIG
ncbi:site-specific integrase [Tsukamurella strandjordii]|uniref:tyrosine-type recombinase/integrase n=1 Tax=Tsukamurella TaxID=2060 RepID=UPI00208C4D2D|nr:site-specific integrase [Tsukamurella sp. TY48]GIZ97497.1 hypothetical protein TTY48_21090 [Tsukamurella sp. TY48]